MFKQGDLVKSKQRTKTSPLFLMVLFGTLSHKQFKGVVIKDMLHFGGDDWESESGYVANNWNISQFELTNWEEVKMFI